MWPALPTGVVRLYSPAMSETVRQDTWNLADVFEGIARVVPDREAVLDDHQVLTWTQLDRQSNALARHLLVGGAVTGDKVAIYSYNRAEYTVTLAACFKARLVPVNINYRYRDEELSYIFDNSDSVAVVFEAGFGPNLERLRAGLPKLEQFIQLDDGEPGLAGATVWATALSGSDEALGNERSPDDMLFLYTGGTTGMPKGVMWRQTDIWASLGAGGDAITGEGKPADLDEHLANAAKGQQLLRHMPACPLMHGTGLLTALNALMVGGSIVTVGSHTLDAHALWRAVAEKKVNSIAIVGDVFARPMVEALGEQSYDLTSLFLIVSSGVMWSPETKKALLVHHPDMVLVDSLGSSEATGFGSSITTANETYNVGTFKIGDRVKVFTDDDREVAPGSQERGRIARAGAIPVGYYKDPEKTARTFPTIDGVRYSIPGDYAQVEADGSLILLGRGSGCINTGGEKVFPEEVEEILKRHDAVEDAAVVGLPDEKWGQAVTALVTPAGGNDPNEAALRDHVRGTLAGYKVPKRIFTVTSLGRSPAGKMDYKGVTAKAKELTGQDGT